MYTESSQRILRSRRSNLSNNEESTPQTSRTNSRNQTRNQRYINFTNTNDRPIIELNQNNEPLLRFPTQNVGQVLKSTSLNHPQQHNQINQINLRPLTAEEIILQRTETVFGFLKKIVIIFTYLALIILILLYIYSVLIKYQNPIYISDYNFNSTTFTQCQQENYANGTMLEHFNSEITLLKEELSKLELKLEEYQKANSILENKLAQNKIENGNVGLDQVKGIISEALALYDADRIGRQDFALASAGAYIIKLRETTPFLAGSRILSFFGIGFLSFGHGPQIILQPNSQPGNCFAFVGDKAKIQIHLAATVYIEAFSIEHISKALIDDRRSAPRKFSVWGITNHEEQTYLGLYEYSLDGPIIQTFGILNKDSHYPHRQIELRILSNYGHPHYTCLYRFRVHGKPFG